MKEKTIQLFCVIGLLAIMSSAYCSEDVTAVVTASKNKHTAIKITIPSMDEIRKMVANAKRKQAQRNRFDELALHVVTRHIYDVILNCYDGTNASLIPKKDTTRLHFSVRRRLYNDLAKEVAISILTPDEKNKVGNGHKIMVILTAMGSPLYELTTLSGKEIDLKVYSIRKDCSADQSPYDGLVRIYGKTTFRKLRKLLTPIVTGYQTKMITNDVMNVQELFRRTEVAFIHCAVIAKNKYSESDANILSELFHAASQVLLKKQVFSIKSGEERLKIIETMDLTALQFYQFYLDMSKNFSSFILTKDELPILAGFVREEIDREMEQQNFEMKFKILCETLLRIEK